MPNDSKVKCICGIDPKPPGAQLCKWTWSCLGTEEIYTLKQDILGSYVSTGLSNSEPSSIDLMAGTVNEKNTQLQQAKEKQIEKELCTTSYRNSFKMHAWEGINQEKKMVATT